MPTRRAFTLVELLVVIGIIALLVGILLPVLSRAQEQSLRIKCAANLRNIGQSLYIYAGDNKGKLPQHAGGSNWLWDLPNRTRDAMLLSGNQRNTLYCPANDRQNVKELWNWIPGDTGYTVSGYFVMIRRPTGNIPAMQAIGVTPVSRKKWLQTLTDKDYPESKKTSPADIELASDATVSSTSNRATAVFTNVKGGWPQPHWSNHFKNSKGTGGNILFLDGHVVWRDFSAMKCWIDGPAQWF